MKISNLSKLSLLLILCGSAHKANSFSKEDILKGAGFGLVSRFCVSYPLVSKGALGEVQAGGLAAALAALGITADFINKSTDKKDADSIAKFEKDRNSAVCAQAYLAIAAYSFTFLFADVAKFAKGLVK